MLARVPFLGRLCTKLFCEFLPAAAVSLVGAALLNHYSRAPSPTPPAAVTDRATAEMLQMARDEHTRIVVLMEKREAALEAADRRQATERAAIIAAQKAKAAQAKAEQAKAAALASAETAGKKTAPKPSAARPETVAFVGAPLPLSAPPAPPNVQVVSVPPREDNVLVTKWKETTAAVERIPGWLRSTVEQVADRIASVPSPRLPRLHIL
jgi:hypothetical protein